MNLRYLQALIYGIYGYVSGYFLAQVMIYAVEGLLLLGVDPNAPLPPWARYVLLVVFYLTFLLVIVFSIFLGLKQGRALQSHADQSAIRKQSHIRLLIGVLVMLAFIGYLSVQKEKPAPQPPAPAQDIDRLKANLRQLKDIRIEQVRDGMLIEVETRGESSGQYLLRLDLRGYGYIFENIKSFSEKIPPNSKRKNYRFFVSFENLSRAYHTILLVYAPALEDGAKIVEYIAVDASLQFLDIQNYIDPSKAGVVVPQSKLTGVTIFRFLCDQEQCRVDQRPDPESENAT